MRKVTGRAVSVHQLRGRHAVRVERLEPRCMLSAGPSSIGHELMQQTTGASAPQLGSNLHPRGDINGSGTVDFGDFGIVMANFGKSGRAVPGDLDRDGTVTIADYNALYLSRLANSQGPTTNHGGSEAPDPRPHMPSQPGQAALTPLVQADADLTGLGPEHRASSDPVTSSSSNVSPVLGALNQSVQSAGATAIGAHTTRLVADQESHEVLAIFSALASAIDPDAKACVDPSAFPAQSNEGHAAIPTAESLAEHSSQVAETANLLEGAPTLLGISLDLHNVQQALETVLGEIDLLKTEVAQWLDDVHLTPMVLAVAPATAGAGAGLYYRRRARWQEGEP